MKPMKLVLDEMESELPIDIAGVRPRLQRAVNDILLMQGVKYDTVKVQSDCYQIHRFSTSVFEDNAVTYQIERQKGKWSCDCPDYIGDGAPYGLCKHVLAVMTLQGMEG